MSSRSLAVLLLLLVLVPACGRKEPPQPPPSRIPAPISDLSIQQRGREIMLTMTYPSVTLGGLPSEDLEAIEIFQMTRIISAMIEPDEEEAGVDETEEASAEDEGLTAEPEESEESEEPEGSLFSLPTAVSGATEEAAKEDLIDVRGRDFAAAAELAWTLRASELDSSVVGDEVIIRMPIDESSGTETEEEILVFGARSIAAGRRPSPFSNLVKLFPRTPPAAPSELSVEASPQGVQVEWKPSADAIGYRVYRRNAKVRDYGEPLYSGSKDSSSHLDRTAEFGRRYIYTVTSVSSDLPLVESAVVAEHEVDYQDRFPPARPTEVVALAETGRVRLLWQPSTSEDTEGYWIYRQDPGRSFEPINTDLVLGSEYLDRDLLSGVVYRYYLLAVDASENQSEPSDEIEVRVP